MIRSHFTAFTCAPPPFDLPSQRAHQFTAMKALQPAFGTRHTAIAQPHYLRTHVRRALQTVETIGRFPTSTFLTDPTIDPNTPPFHPILPPGSGLAPVQQPIITNNILYRLPTSLHCNTTPLKPLHLSHLFSSNPSNRPQNPSHLFCSTPSNRRNHHLGQHPPSHRSHRHHADGPIPPYTTDHKRVTCTN